MASQRKIAVFTCLLVFVLMDNAVHAKKKKGLKQLVAKVDELEKKVECNPCKALQEHGKRLDTIEEEIAKLNKPVIDELKKPACKFDFEDGIGDWVRTGTAFDNQPTYGDNPTARNRGQPANQQGDWWIGGAEDRPSPDDPAGRLNPGGGDGPKGTLTSPSFVITGRYITFLVGGGCDINVVRVELVIGDLVVRKVTGKCTETMHRETWDVIEFYGESAQVRLVDDSDGGWGHINFDDMKGDITCQ